MNVEPSTKVTIAIPTFNRARYLKEAIDSALSQTWPHIEVLISDNASTDSTRAYLATLDDPRIRVILQAENIGMMANWNACLAAATGKYFLMLSDDDLIEPTAVAELLGRFEESARYGMTGTAEEIGMVYCHARIIDERGEQTALAKGAPAWEPAAAAIDAFFACNRHTFPCTILLRTADAASLGGYDAPAYPLIADAQMWMKVALKRGMVGHIGATLSSYRQHRVSTTKTVRIQAWMDDNVALAAFCAAQLEQRGDARLAAAILSQADWYNAVAAAALLDDSAAPGISRAWQYLKLSRNFLAASTARVVAVSAVKLLLSRNLKSRIKRTLGATHTEAQ